MGLAENIRFSATTDVGRLRDHNEDNYLVDKKLCLFVVADGMGGHAAGEVASALAVRIIHEELRKERETINVAGESRGGGRTILLLLEQAVQRACARIHEEARADTTKRGMGTTLSALLIVGPHGYIAHVGDSRIYLLRDGRIQQVTEDHTVFNELVKRGKLTREQIEKVAQKNAITRAVGVYERVEVDTLTIEVLPGDQFLLASDGLHGYIAHQAELEPYFDEVDPQNATDGLVELANRKGGKDNITAVLVRLGEGDAKDSVRARRLALKRELLLKMPLFARLNERELLRVMQVAEVIGYEAEEVIVREGDRGDELFIVLSGVVRIHKGETVLLEIGPGDHFGEMALIRAAPRSATVTALADSELIAIRRSDFFEILRKEHELAVKLLWQFLGVLADRLDQTTRDLSSARQELAAEDISDAIFSDTEEPARSFSGGALLQVPPPPPRAPPAPPWRPCRWTSPRQRPRIAAGPALPPRPRAMRVDTFHPRPVASVASGQRYLMRISARCAWRMGGPAAAIVTASAVALFPGTARADEPRNATEPRVMLEPGEVVNVIDAFDEGNPFDINISLGFDYLSKSAKILRETAIAGPGLTSGGFTTHLLNVANYAETTARLTPRVDVGLYHDIAVHIALPVILSNSRSLSLVGGLPPVADATAGAPGEAPLFGVPFTSPTRSGLQHIAAGIDFDILNQARDRTKPTWLFGFEGRFSVGTPMHACNPNAPKGQLQCADPSDINRSGKQDVGTTGQFEGTYSSGDRGAGASRGTIALEVHTLMSRRFKYVEPYGGFTALFEFQQDSSDYGISDVSQTLVNHPPLVGTMIAGMMIIPWENREKFGRLTFDLRFMGQYHSEGRDYSELFDALGSSAASSLRQPNWSGYMANGTIPCTATGAPCSVVDPTSQKVYTTGLTDVLAYGSFRGSASVMWQINEYLKIQFGLGYGHDQGHVITGDAPCNPSGSGNPTSGPCHVTGRSGYQVTGVPNPNYRATINDVGRRFWVDDSNTFDLFASIVAMF